MLTVIIPTLNAENALSQNLAVIAGERVIVSDSGSNDATLNVALKNNAVLAVGTSGRGPQLARGGKLALLTDADWLLFLHSDTRLPKNWKKAVETHMRKRPHCVGYFRYAVQAKGVWPLIQAFLVALRCWWWKMPYGDQGLLIPRDVYESVGGYSDLPLFEDVDMMNRLKAEIGRLRIHRLSAKVHTDVSAYDAQGWWTRGARNFKLFRAFQKGASIEDLTSQYYRAPEG